MSAQDNATTLGKPNQNLVLETAGRIYVKVQDRFYELDFRNQGRGAGDTKIEIVNNNTTNQDIDLKGYVTKEFLKASLNSYVTKRSWNDVKETQSMLENAMLDGFTESINPITIQTMQVIVGADQLQFEFVNDFEHAVETAYGPTLGKNSINFEDPGTGIFIKHYTLDGPTDVRPEDPSDQQQLAQLKMQYCRWQIAPKYFDLGDPSASYYIYIKVPKLQDNGTWINSSNPMTILTKTNAPGTNIYNQYSNHGLGEFVLSNSAIEMTAENDYYYLLYGMINSDSGEGRSFSTMNGFTEILPGQITAYIFKSASGDSYLDLRQNVLKLGDAFMWNIDRTGHVGDQILYIKGAIVVDDGNNEGYMHLDRGMFHRFRYQTTENGSFDESDFCNPTGAYHVEGNVYYPGNVVTWTNEKGLTSSYIYIYEPTQPNETQPNAYNSCDYDPETIEADSYYDAQSTYYDPTNEKYWRVLAQGVRGYSNLIADLTNEMEAVACDKDGYVIAENGLDVVTQIGLYYGSSDVEIDKDQTLVTLSNPEGSKITIDLSEILTINPQPEDPNASPNPTVTVSIDPIQNSYLKTLTFSLDHGVLLPEKCEIPITIISKDKFGEDQDDTRTIVFTLVGVRSGKAYSLVPSARTIRRTPLGLYDPSMLECSVVCNGSSENVVASEIVVKHIRGNSAIIHTEAHPEGVQVSVDNVSSYLNDFINDHDSEDNHYSLDWNYTTQYISFENPTYEKITFFLYYKDPLSNNWILCDKETILVVKDGDPGKDFSISSSSQVFMYETETSKVPLNSTITLTGVPKNIKEVDYYEWKYRIPEHPSLNVWTSISPTQGSQEVYPEHSTWWKPDDDPTEQGYQANEQLISTLIIHAPIQVTNNGVTTIDYRDFDIYFPRVNQNDETSRYRMCEFQVTIHYKELGVATSLSDSTSLHIIKGGDGSFTIYLTNPSMIFASTEKKGVSLNLAEETEIIAHYGLDQILPVENSQTSGQVDSSSLITADIIRYKYRYVQNKVEYDSPDYTGSGSVHTNNGSTYESIDNVITARVYVKTVGTAPNQTKHLFVEVRTGQSNNSNPFNGISGEIDVQITVKTPDKLQEEHTVVRTIYWNTAKQGEIGVAKQPRGRSDWSSNGYPTPSGGYEMYQGTEDTEDNWEGGNTQPWNEKHNIFFDIVRIVQGPNLPDLTYYCIKGGPGAATHEPGVTSGWETYWTLMTYANIASDVAYINNALIETIIAKVTKVEQLFTGNTSADADDLSNRIVISGTTADFYDSNENALTSITTASGTFDGSTPASQSSISVNPDEYEQENITNRTGFEVETYNFAVAADNCTVTLPPVDILIKSNDTFFENVIISVELRKNNNIIDLGTKFGSSRNSLTYSLTSISRKFSKTVSGDNWKLYVKFDYDIVDSNPSIDYRINFRSPRTISFAYQGTYADGNVLANNGMKSVWSNNGFVCTSGGLKKMRNTVLYNVVDSGDIETIYVTDIPPTPSSPSGLYFVY